MLHHHYYHHGTYSTHANGAASRAFSTKSTTTTTATTETTATTATPSTESASTSTPTVLDDATTSSGTTSGTSLLDAFRDPLTREERIQNPVGRSWHARELRRKSFDDLHKLWFVLYKERNMLLTEGHLARRHQTLMIQPERLRKVRKSMGAIKQVLGERKREKLASFALRQMALAEQNHQAAMAMEDNDEEDDLEWEEVQDEQKEDKK